MASFLRELTRMDLLTAASSFPTRRTTQRSMEARRSVARALDEALPRGRLEDLASESSSDQARLKGSEPRDRVIRGGQRGNSPSTGPSQAGSRGRIFQTPSAAVAGTMFTCQHPGAGPAEGRSAARQRRARPFFSFKVTFNGRRSAFSPFKLTCNGRRAPFYRSKSVRTVEGAPGR